MWIVAEFCGDVNEFGILAGMDFGDVKATFRKFIDETYDHHLLLNRDDQWAQALTHDNNEPYTWLPGLVCTDGDPTTENIAQWIGEWCIEQYGGLDLVRFKVEVWETQVNSATWEVARERIATD